MTVYIGWCMAGVFALEGNRVVAFKLFDRNPESIARKLASLDAGGMVDDLQQVLAEAPGASYKQPNPAAEFLRENFRRLAVEKGFVKDNSELNKIISGVAMLQTKTKISKGDRRDRLIVQSINALNDLDKILNLMTERLREWYGLHYPELRVADHEKFLEQVASYGSRDKFPGFSNSIGAQLGPEDIGMLKDYASRLKELYKLRKELERYLELVGPQEMPNTKTLLGSLLAARLLAATGSMERLAKMPSSTIQLVGAEKSLFKFLKSKDKNARPPRFGILYVHPDISTARRELQGKIARLLSSKLTLAIRADFYSKNDISAQLLVDYKRKLEEIKKTPIKAAV